jgi:3-methyladenine DNA glycosylase AlkD
VTKHELLKWLEKKGTQRNRDGMARYGIVTPKAFGVPMGAMLTLVKKHGKDHALAAALWRSGWHEARVLAAMLDDPAHVTRQQMDAWARDFDNWAICDTVCWHLFDYTPFAWEKLRRWSTSPREFVKRAAFATMAGQAGHNKTATDAQFMALLPIIEKGAADERNFVKKAVSWALRRIGHRSLPLHAAALQLAKRLADSEPASSRWVGRDVLRDLSRPTVRAKLARLARRRSAHEPSPVLSRRHRSQRPSTQK